MGKLSFQISTLNTLTVCVVHGTKIEVMMAVNTLLRNGDEIVLTVCSSIKLRVEMFVCLRNSYVTKGRNSLLVEDDPDAELPKNPEDFKPVIPKWPTPTGKKEKDVKKHCEAKIKVSATYKSCRRVLGVRFSIKGAVEQCVADTLLTDSFEMSIPAALATMKTICLDVANDY